MKRVMTLAAAIFALATMNSAAQVSPTDRMAVNSGVSLWRNAWKSTDKTDLAKLEPLYGKSIVTRTAAAADQVKQSWAEFATAVRERGADLAAVVSGDKETPKNTVLQDRVVTTFSSGVRLVWEKVNGVWIITEQNLPLSRNTMTALAE
jgi:hypothetical protein